MCFSETASFTAAAILSVQGLLSLNLVKKQKRFFLLACIPFLFAIQQFSEGIVWHYFNSNLPIEGFGLLAAKLFLLFAFIVWPLMIPLSLLAAETEKTKKQLLFLFFIGGVLWSLYLILNVPYSNLVVKQEAHHIIYTTNFFSEQSVIIMRCIYLGLLMIPIFISSLRLIWVFGILTILSALVSYYFYAEAFTSVWCFFGALLSLILYQVLRVNIRK